MTDFEKLTSSVEKQTILIVGDVMIDSYLWGNVERISPEAPVPIVAVNRRENRLGGAANVALNIQAMGAKPIMCTVLGNDEKANEFITLMKNTNMDTQGIIKSDDRITTVKFRTYDIDLTKPFEAISMLDCIKKYTNIDFTNLTDEQAIALANEHHITMQPHERT